MTNQTKNGILQRIQKLFSNKEAKEIRHSDLIPKGVNRTIVPWEYTETNYYNVLSSLSNNIIYE